jgi:hypothetical protein
MNTFALFAFYFGQEVTKAKSRSKTLGNFIGAVFSCSPKKV